MKMEMQKHIGYHFVNAGGTWTLTQATEDRCTLVSTYGESVEVPQKDFWRIFKHADVFTSMPELVCRGCKCCYQVTEDFCNTASLKPSEYFWGCYGGLNPKECEEGR